uniref:Fructose-2,6-bisphosphatase n=1 Tax=uncultured Chloroflexi bacterium HF0200_09I09 TaxID=710736 RepID=E0XU83_9CHLR|nr:fructose-2,6-bisphosphatase [uncultured Chloroflexi bacterium HF0200_09I09]
MMTRFLLFRHAEAEGNAAGQTQGRIDRQLTKYGRSQATDIEHALDPFTPVALYSSPASRARETAGVIEKEFGLELVVDERLHELDHGHLDGRTIEDIRQDHSDFIERWRDEDIADLRFPGGETMGEVQRRMLAVLDEIAHRHDGADVAVVSHNLALKALLAHALGIALSAARRFELGLASLTVVERRSGEDAELAGWSVVTLNDRCHLSEKPL